MLGEGANWVANGRAAGGGAGFHYGRDEAVRLEGVDEHDRVPILKRCLEIALAARPHIAVDRGGWLTEFERIAGRYPVFHIVPNPGSRSSG